MFQPSTSRDPLLTRGGDSGSLGGESVEEHAFDDDFSVWEMGDFTDDDDESQTLTPISATTVVEGVDAKVLKVPDEDQRFTFVEFSPDWSLMVAVTSDGTFSVWDTTDEFVFLGSRRFQQHQRTLKRIAFDSYNKEAVLLCFDSGEIVRTNLRGVATEDVPTSSHVQRMFDTEVVYKCEGRNESRYAHFTFSSDRKMMVYYNLDGEFVAIQFLEQGSPKSMTLSKSFVLKQKINIYVSKQNVLVAAVMRSSEDYGFTGHEIETLLWSELDFKDVETENKPASFRGKGYLSNDGSYVVTSMLISSKHSTRCRMKVYRVTNVKSDTNERGKRLATRWLSYQSNHPEMECLDGDVFSSLNAERKKKEPLVTIKQTNATGSRLVFWDIDLNAIIFEIDLTLDKGVQDFSEVGYCCSLDYKWIGVYSADANMVGLIFARSGAFVWTAKVPHINGEETEFYGLKFDPAGTRLMIYLGKTMYLFEPPCLSKKPPKHPMYHNTILTQTTRPYTDFEILEKAKEWPKQVLFNVLLTGHGVEKDVQGFLLDVAISLRSKRLAMVCQKEEGRCFLFILEYSETLSREWLWFLVLLRWNQCFLDNSIVSLAKELEGEQEHKWTSVFYYPHVETNDEQIVLLSSKGGIKMQDLNLQSNQLSEWKRLSEHDCLSFAQSKDQRHVISLADRHVFIISLNEKSIIKNVEYSISLSQWWESFMYGVQCFGYSQYHAYASQEYDMENKLRLQDRLRGLFDVSDDGETILIGWDNKQNRGLILTRSKSEEQFRVEWDEARESLYKCSMLTGDGRWIGYLDYEKLKSGHMVICVVDITNNRQKRIWLGSSKSLVKPLSKSELPVGNFFIHLNQNEEKLTVLGLEEIGASNNLKELSVEVVVEDDKVIQEHTSLLQSIVQPTNLDEYGKKNQPSTFNMIVANASNFQRVLLEEGESMMAEVAKHALDNKVKVSTVYYSHNSKDHDSTTFLTHALETKDASLVKLCLRFIEDGLFPFNSAATMVKDSFFELLFSYTEFFLPILENKSFTLQVADVNVPSNVFRFQKGPLNLVFTSDTILEWEDRSGATLDEDFWESNGIPQPARNEDYRVGMKVLSSVSFHCIANACKVGLNGIIRKLLMKAVPTTIFKTELIRATITWKWEKLMKRKCLQEMCLYLLFLGIFTSYAIGIGISFDRASKDERIQQYLPFTLIASVSLAIYFACSEFLQLITYINDGKEVFGTYEWGFKHYLSSQWNLLELLSYFLVVVIIPIFHWFYVFGDMSIGKFFFSTVAIECILAWFKLWYYFQAFDKTGALVLLISNVVYDCFPFLVLAFVILAGFSVALFVMFQCCSIHLQRHFACEEATCINESFESLWRSLLTMFFAIVGEVESEVYYSNQCFSWLTTLTFIVYMALEMIVMLNMLIAIMGDTFDRVKSEEDVQITIGRACFMDAYEASLSVGQIREIEKRIGKFLYILTPKEGDYNVDNNNWKGKINVIEENVKKAVKVLETNVMNGIEENKKAIKDYKEEMENKMQEHFNRIELVFRTTVEEHK